MKKIQIYRLLVQLTSLILVAIGFFIQFEFTMMIILIATIFAGAYYCGWICPYGTLQDLTSKLGKRIGIKKRKMPKAIQQYLFYIRYILFAIFMIFTIDFLFTLFTYDPRVNLLSLIGGHVISTVAIIVLTSFLAIALFFDRPFCNYLCIEGAKYGLFSLLRPMTFRRNDETCINCKKCDKACPMNIEVSTTEQLHSPNCVNCFQCSDACPVKETLTYGPVKVTPLLKTYYIKMIVLALVLGSSFLVYSITAGNSDETANSLLSENTTTSEFNSDDITTEDPSLDEDQTSENEVLETEHGDGNGNNGNGKGKNRKEDHEDHDTDASDIENEDIEPVVEEPVEEVVDPVVEEPVEEVTDPFVEESVEEVIEPVIEEPVEVVVEPVVEEPVEEVIEPVVEEPVEEVVEPVVEEPVEEIVQATGDAAGIPDGSYIGVGRGYNGDMTVQITVVNEEITNIQVIDFVDDYKWFVRAFNSIIPSILSSQSANVSTVSGATYSSEGIIDAVKAALESAGN